MKYFLLILILLAGAYLPAQSKKERKLIIVTFDGFRWKEAFRGADSTKLFGKEFTSQDSANRVGKFWAATVPERREKLMPFLWNTIAGKGQIYGNRDKGSLVNVKNPYWFSYPGYNEIFTGYPDTAINSNGFAPNPNVTIQEFINKLPGYRGKVAAFTSWSAFDRILNKERSGLPVNAGYTAYEEPKANETQKTLSRMQFFLPKVFGSSERPDAITFFLAMEYLKQHHPRVLQISFIETDAFAHQGKYDFYLDAAHYNDAMLEMLWNTIQSDPFYKDQTTLFIATDHGRGEDNKWTSHNNKTTESDQVWFAVMGPFTPPIGEIKNGQVYQYQYAKTMAALLGIDFTSPHAIGKKIDQAVK